jgi:hypothetical protein
VLGAPQLRLHYRGQAPKANARVLAQIVDESTGKVLGNQITPIPVNLDGRSHAVDLPLETMTATATARSHFELQLVAQSTLYNTHPLGGSVSFSDVRISLPDDQGRQLGSGVAAQRRFARDVASSSYPIRSSQKGTDSGLPWNVVVSATVAPA